MSGDAGEVKVANGMKVADDVKAAGVSTEQLIGRLMADLEPVRRLRPPWVRALLALALVSALSLALLLPLARGSVITARLAQPRIALECAGMLLTGVTALFSAFFLSVPGRSPRWGLLPLPSLLLWLAVSGLGCLQNGLSLHGPDGFIGESGHCFVFIAGASLPLTVLLFALLRRARPIAPLPVALAGALASAAFAAFLLEFFHPFDVTVIDLALHLAAMLLIVSIGAAFRRPLLAAG
jgi:hypothetical protein